MNKKDYHSDDYQYFAADNLVVDLAVPGKLTLFTSFIKIYFKGDGGYNKAR